MQKKTLGLERNQILNQGRVFWGEGRGRGLGCKVIWRIVRTSEKILATPLCKYLLVNVTLESFENWTLCLARTRFYLSFVGL